MAIYAVCLGMTLVVDADEIQEAIEKARSELQCKLDECVGEQGRDAWSFDMYQVSKMNLKKEALILDQN